MRTLPKFFAELARVARIAEEHKVSVFNCIKCTGRSLSDLGCLGVTIYPNMTTEMLQRYTFALGVVEGKPVFEGDTLYCTEPECTKCLYTGLNKFEATVYDRLESASWNPPKPKTVTLEVSYEAAECVANWGSMYSKPYVELVKAAELALSKLDQ